MRAADTDHCAKSGDSGMADTAARARSWICHARGGRLFLFHTVDDWHHGLEGTTVRVISRERPSLGPLRQRRLRSREKWVRPELAPWRGGGGGSGSEAGRCTARVGTPLAPPWQVPE